MVMGTLCGNTELDEFKVKFILTMLVYWSHTTVILQTDQEQVAAGHCQFGARSSPPVSSRETLSAKHVERVGTCKLKLERQN